MLITLFQRLKMVTKKIRIYLSNSSELDMVIALNKLNNTKDKVFIHCENEEIQTYLDRYIWIAKSNFFIPHVTIHDSGKFDINTASMLISYYEENVNSALYLVLSNFLSNIEFLMKFENILIFLSPEQKHIVEKIQKNYYNKGVEIVKFTKENNQWSKTI